MNKKEDNLASKDTRVLGARLSYAYADSGRCEIIVSVIENSMYLWIKWRQWFCLQPPQIKKNNLKCIFIYYFTEVTMIWCKVPALLVNIMLSVLTVVGSVAMVITLPLYSSSVICAGSDPYSVLFFSSFWFQLVSKYQPQWYSSVFGKAVSISTLIFLILAHKLHGHISGFWVVSRSNIKKSFIVLEFLNTVQ